MIRSKVSSDSSAPRSRAVWWKRLSCFVGLVGIIFSFKQVTLLVCVANRQIPSVHHLQPAHFRKHCLTFVISIQSFCAISERDGRNLYIQGGRICIDGQDINEVSLTSLRRAAMVVAQDVFLFTTTLENNIAYGEPLARLDEIEGAADDAQIHDHIAGLDARYQTLVGERGSSLSGGQRQRLAIARALVSEPSILIFDDSTAAVDAATEARLRIALQAGSAERVTLIVAHRLNSLQHADRILVLDQGRLVETGTHADLLAQGGLYRALYDLQTNAEDREGT